MYANQSLKKTNRIKISTSDRDLEIIEAAVEIDGGQLAVIARQKLLEWAENVIRNARATNTGTIKTSIGIVNPDGGIRYRLSA